MDTRKFKSAIQSAQKRPLGVIVSEELYKELMADGLIEKKWATPNGVISETFGLELPYYDSDIYIHCDPFLESDYVLPPN